MKRYKSILATATLAVFGFGAVARIPHAGISEDDRHVQAHSLNAPAPVGTMGWVNPPAHASALGTLSNAVITTAQAAEVAEREDAGDNRLRQTQAPQRAAAVRRKPAIARREAYNPTPATQLKAKVSRPHKVAQRRIPVYQSSLKHKVPMVPVLEEQGRSPNPRAAERFDPISNLIHGLGLDS